jgi:hypothetical protein
MKTMQFCGFAGRADVGISRAQLAADLPTYRAE